MSLQRLVSLLEARETIKVTWIDDTVIRVTGNNKEVILTTNQSEHNSWGLDSKWLDHPQIVVSKVVHKLGLSTRIHARKCIVKRIDKPTLDQFLEDHHINGVAGAKHKFGLFYKEELVSIASFAAPRTINNKKSGALVRFCIKSNYSIPGGLDKLIQHYLKEYPCNDIFTYVDLNWSTGSGFERIGFVEEGVNDSEGKPMLRLRLTVD